MKKLTILNTIAVCLILFHIVMSYYIPVFQFRHHHLTESALAVVTFDLCPRDAKSEWKWIGMQFNNYSVETEETDKCREYRKLNK